MRVKKIKVERVERLEIGSSNVKMCDREKGTSDSVYQGFE